MPIEVAIWRIDDGKVEPVPASSLDKESRLEDVLERDISILGLDSLLVIGRQVVTTYGKRVDLLAIDVEGSLYVIELKKDRTPREVVAQARDYGFWVRQLDDEAIAGFYAHHNDGENFAAAFEKFFDQPPPATLNESHQLIIVASELDPSTERIVSYAADYDIPLNVVFFQYFRDGDAEYLTRSWLIDPAEAEERSRARFRSRPQATWNGQDFYYSAGEGDRRNWDDMVRYGFISAGGGRWYSNTLKQLEPGHRVFACIPKTGYVGLGVVKESVKPVGDFEVDTDAGRLPILDAPLKTGTVNRRAPTHLAWSPASPLPQKDWRAARVVLKSSTRDRVRRTYPPPPSLAAGPTRDELIAKGLIYAPRRGTVAFHRPAIRSLHPRLHRLRAPRAVRGA